MLNAEPEIQYVALTSISEIMDTFVFPFLHSYKVKCSINGQSRN